MENETLSPALVRLLTDIASGYETQTRRLRGIEFAVLAGMLESRGLVRVVKRRDHTRPYALTVKGKAYLTP